MADSLSDLARRLLPFIRRSIGCRVISTATQAISNTTETALSFNSEISDTGDCWASGSPTRLTAPVAGYYLAGGGVLFGSSLNTNAGRIYLALRANGTVYLAADDKHTIANKDAALLVSSGRFWLEVGEYVELMFYHEQGGSRTLVAATTTYQNNKNGWLQLVD